MVTTVKRGLASRLPSGLVELMEFANPNAERKHFLVVELKKMVFAWARYDDYEENYDADGDIGVNIDEGFIREIKRGYHLDCHPDYTLEAVAMKPDWIYKGVRYNYDINYRIVDVGAGKNSSHLIDREDFDSEDSDSEAEESADVNNSTVHSSM